MGKQKLPTLFEWIGGTIPSRWSFGWWTGRDDDLICVKPDILNETEAEICLSPVCRNRFLAIVGFILKRILLHIDENMKMDYKDKVAL